MLVWIGHDARWLNRLLKRRYVFDLPDALILDMWLNLLVVAVVSNAWCGQRLLLQETGQTLFGVLILIEFALTALFDQILRCL